MADKLGPMDVAMNFLGFELTLGADSSVLVSAQVPTGMSPRTGVCMLIHQAEYFLAALSETDGSVSFALSTRAGLGTIPSLTDDGTLDAFGRATFLTTSGIGVVESPVVHKWWPPIALATSKLVLYAKASADLAGYQSKTIRARLGFTTAPLDAAMYREIAETWGW